MIGIIIWLLLIVIIAFCACPGFLSALGVIFGIFAFCIFILWVLARLTGKKAEEAQGDPEETLREREKAIKEWERKWGRKHPTRK